MAFDIVGEDDGGVGEDGARAVVGAELVEGGFLVGDVGVVVFV